MGGRVPDFFLVGHAKCGTTALYEMLRQHPGIFLPGLKEPMFLAGDLQRRFQPPRAGALPGTLEEYLALFAPASANQLVGEASTIYLNSTAAAPAIAALNPEARIIGIFREPVSYLRSLHFQLLRNHNEVERDLRRALALEDARRRGHHIPRRSSRPQMLRYSEHVRYTDQLGRYRAVFSPGQILVLIYDDLLRDDVAVVRQMYRFLGVDDSVSINRIQANRTVAVVRSQALDDAVHRVSVGRGPISRSVKAALKAVMPPRVRRQLLSTVQSRLVDGEPPLPDDALIEQLRAWVRPEVERFSEYLDRDLVGLWGYDRA